MRHPHHLVLAAAVLLTLPACTGCDSTIVAKLKPPTITVDPGALDYGRVPVGIAVDRAITITNGGEEDLVIREFSVGGTLPVAAFRVLDNVPNIAPHASFTVRLEFNPPQQGVISADMHIRSNADNQPDLVFPLTGEGIPGTVCGDCASPPTSYCASPNILIVYEPMGTCVMGQCLYDATRLVCLGGCVDTTLMCINAVDGGVRDAGARDAAMVPDAAVILDAAVIPDAAIIPDAAVVPDAALPPDAGNNPGLYTTPGEHMFTVPAGVTSLSAALWGGGGAGGQQQMATGGGAGAATGLVPVTPGETLVVWVAEGGVQPGNGGGASAILRGTTPLLLAPGGGGGGSDGCSGCKSGGRGGAGGGTTGESGANLVTTLAPFCTSATGGAGGTPAMGGTGGSATGSAFACPGLAGALYTGGRGSGVNNTCDATPGAFQWHQGGGQGNGGGGGGGAGYYGGGAAGFIWTYCAGGGGGGSGFSAVEVTGSVLQGGVAQAQGNAATSSGAGRGGDMVGNGANGRVQLMW